MTENIKAWIKFNQIKNIKSSIKLNLIELYGEPLNFLGQPVNFFNCCDFLSPESKNNLANCDDLENWDRIRDLMHKYDINFLPITSEEYPKLLKEIFQPPLFLFFRGSFGTEIIKNTLAVVGTRKPTSYGKIMTPKLSKELVEAGFTIVSGLAAGIDSMAHRTSLENNGNTVAVLGTGCEQIYPSSNRNLASLIIKSKNALISEYVPGTKPEKWFFPRRNRIISGLSKGVIVIEGKINSGALLTAKLALDQNRDIFALPGDINRPQSEGPNLLIKNGAIPINSIEDILNEYQLLRQEKVKKATLLTNDEQIVHRIVVQEKPDIHFDEIMILTNMSVQKLSAVIFSLEMKSMIIALPGKKYAAY